MQNKINPASRKGEQRVGNKTNQMKKLLILFLFPCHVYGQDTLITTKGEVIPCKVTIISPETTTYQINGKLEKISNSLIFDKKINGKPFISTPQNELAVKTNFTLNSIDKLQDKQIEEIYLAGVDLKKASNRFYGGLITFLVGNTLTNWAFITKNETARSILLATGGASITVGTVISLTSFAKIRGAGKHLIKVKSE